MNSTTKEQFCSFKGIPTDVWSQIALWTVSLAYGVPTPRDLNTVFSLVLTCRLFYRELARGHNPDLYAKIFRLMFDISTVKRRLGASAITSSLLSEELKELVEVLIKIKACFKSPELRTTRWKTILPAFNRAVLMMIDNDGKNRFQLMDVAKTVGVENLLISREMTGDNAPNADLAVLVALTELGRAEVELLRESSGRRFTIIDLLHPFVSSESWSNDSNVRSSAITIQYFGRHCRFRPASLTLLARICTVCQYKVLKRIYNAGSNHTNNIPSTLISSSRFGNDRFGNFTIDYPQHRDGEMGPLARCSHGYALRTFDGVWEGQLFIPSVPQNFTCALPMQTILREFVSPNAEEAVTFDGDEDDDDHELARAWFPEGTVFKESTTSVDIYDPVKRRWFTYESSESIRTSNEETSPVFFDTILMGHTDHVHGASHGEYTFHGRVQKSGRVALVRRPADARMVDLGIWVFYGQLHVGTEFIGDWRNTSSHKYIPAAQGWFQLSKIAIRPGVEAQ